MGEKSMDASDATCRFSWSPYIFHRLLPLSPTRDLWDGQHLRFSTFSAFPGPFLFFTTPTSSSFGRRPCACYLWIRCFRRRHSETYKHIVVYVSHPRPKGKPFLWTYPCARFNFGRRLFYRHCRGFRCHPLERFEILYSLIIERDMFFQLIF